MPAEVVRPTRQYQMRPGGDAQTVRGWMLPQQLRLVAGHDCVSTVLFCVNAGSEAVWNKTVTVAESGASHWICHLNVGNTVAELVTAAPFAGERSVMTGADERAAEAGPATARKIATASTPTTRSATALFTSAPPELPGRNPASVVTHTAGLLQARVS